MSGLGNCGSGLPAWWSRPRRLGDSPGVGQGALEGGAVSGGVGAVPAMRDLLGGPGAVAVVASGCAGSAVSAAVSFAVLLPGLLVAHQVGDHWVQTSSQAVRKGLPGWVGRVACVAHVATYTAVIAMTVVGLWVTLGLSITVWGVVAGQVVSAVSHYWADRRTTLGWLCERTGKGGFYRLGAPRPGRDDNPSLGTGAYALDQSWHWFWLLVAALVTAVTP